MLSNKILQSTIAKRLGIIRKKRELTMSALAERSGVSKGTLSVLEDGSGNPTISTLWSISDALNVPFSELVSISPHTVKPQADADGVTLQLIDQASTNLRIEAYHMSIQANSHREATPHPSGVMEHVTVLKGHLLIGPLDTPKLIGVGEHFTFKADCPHIYSAPTDSVSAIVTVQYPKNKQLSSEHTIVKSVPTTQEEWVGLVNLIHRNSIEVANGLPIFRLLIRTGLEPEIVARNVEARLLIQQKDHYKIPVSLYFISEKEQLCLYIFPKSKGCTYNPEKHPTEEKDEHKILAYCKANNVILDTAQINFLKNVASVGNLLCATLASEALSIQGIPTLPHQVNQCTAHQQSNKITSKLTDRLEIQSKSAYQLLRLGYARQMLVVGEMLLKYANKHRRILVMGEHLELDLAMLVDSISDLDISTVKPRRTTFSDLQKKTNNLNITSHYSDFLTLNNAIKYSTIISTNTSDQLHTAYFLQKAQTLLEDNGILIIADDIIPSFYSEEEKNQALIRHHVNYMLDIVRIVTCDTIKNSFPNDYVFIEPYTQELPIIAFMAITHSVDIAISRLKRLHETLQKNVFKLENTILLGYYHLLTLELDALMAEINNKIECKTSVENIFALAESSGLSLIKHQRVYATFGKSKTGGGTHVFVFQKKI
jgi:transcriptional regulator with XRE-family HTH domain